MLDKKTKGNEIEFRTPSKKKPLIGILLILVSLIGYVFFTKTLSVEVSEFEATILTKIDRIELIQDQIAEYEQAEEEYGISTEVQRMESLKSIPANMDQDEVIRDLIEISDNYDIELNSLSFGESVSDQEGIGSLRINAGFEGNYNDLVNFLEGLEQNARLFKINTISVQINRLEILDIVRANFSLTMEAYFQS